MGKLSLLDFFFPKRCLNCSRLGVFICGKCAGNIETSLSVCPVCERASMLGDTHIRCRKLYSLDGLTSGFKYKTIIQKAVRLSKYQPYQYSLISNLAKLLYKNIILDKGFNFFIEKKPVLVPIPLFWWKKHIRGYNQAEILTRELGKLLKLPTQNLLSRKKQTKPQYGLSSKQRKANLSEAFTAKQNILPKAVILVDDVWTTGSTLKSACNTLKRRGVLAVWGLTLAR